MLLGAAALAPPLFPMEGERPSVPVILPALAGHGAVRASSVPVVITSIHPSRLRYSSDKALGFGGCSDVFDGTLDGMPVVIKRACGGDEEDVRMHSSVLVHEAFYYELCTDAAIVGCYGLCWDPSAQTLALVLERMVGGDLLDARHASQDAMQEHAGATPLLSTFLTGAVLRDVASALVHLHKRQLVHGDVHLGNVMLGRPLRLSDWGRGRPGADHAVDVGMTIAKLADFGKMRRSKRQGDTVPPAVIKGETRHPSPSYFSVPGKEDFLKSASACEVCSWSGAVWQDGPATLSLLRTSSSAGGDPCFQDFLCTSPSYTAPEVLMGAQRSSASDIWSWGIIAWELTIGSLPWDSSRIQDMRKAAVAVVQWAPPTECPPSTDPATAELYPLLCQALRHDAMERPSAHEVLTGMEAWLAAHYV